VTVKAPFFVEAFRQAGPYINAHRGKTFVVLLAGEAVMDTRFSSLVHDLSLLHSLGIRLVLVHGARPQIEARLREAGQQVHYVNGLRVTDESALLRVKEAVGRVRIRIEASLSMGLANSPMHGARIRVVSGNFVTARPLGIREGVDYCFTGEVRRIDIRAINTWLDNGAIVLLSPLGYSPTGEIFNVSAEEVAIATATALQADKLLLLSEATEILKENGEVIQQLSPHDAQHLLVTRHQLPEAIARQLDQALRACRAGVRRIHMINRAVDGALLLELFTRDGIGLLLTTEIYEGVRPATIDDVGGILTLIRPLETDGTLVRRSRELLEIEIERFTILERDGAIIGCAALYPFVEERLGELACLAVAPDYRNHGRADVLLQFIERQAQKHHLTQLFVLTTRAAHWFQERGFKPAQVDDLPLQKQTMYNLQRRSKVFIKVLGGTMPVPSDTEGITPVSSQELTRHR
jgi:amino-acid N-acetyltransferase